MYKDASHHQVTTLNKLGTKQYGIYTLKEKCYQPVPLFLKTKSYIFHKSLWGIQVNCTIHNFTILKPSKFLKSPRLETSHFSNYSKINSDARFINRLFALIPNTLISFCIMSANQLSVSVFSDIYMKFQILKVDFESNIRLIAQISVIFLFHTLIFSIRL